MAEELDDAIKISDKTLMAPLVLAKNLEEVYKVAQLIAKDKGITTVMNTATTSTKKLKDETTVLTKQTQQLVTVQKAMAQAVQADSKAYTQEVAVLQKLNATTKDTLSTTDKEIKGLKEKRASLDANRIAYAGYRTETERNTKEAKALLKTIQSQASELDVLVDKTDKNTKSSVNFTSVLTSMKAELKAAEGEMAHIATTLGVESEEFKEAAERAGALKDEMGDLKEATKAVSGEPIERLGGSFDLLKGKLASLDFKGATGALKGITSATKDLTFKTAIAGAGGFGKAMAGLGKALFLNPIFLVAAVIIGIGVAVFKLKDSIPFLTKAFDVLGDGIDYVVQKGKEFSDWALGSNFIVEEKAEIVAKAARKEVDAIRERYDDEIAIAEASGKAVVDLERKKQEEILKEATKGIVALGKIRKKTPEQEEQYAEFLSIVKNANRDIQIEEARHQTELRKLREEAAKEAEKIEDERFKVRQEKFKEDLSKIKEYDKQARTEFEKAFDKETEDIVKATQKRGEAIIKAQVPVVSKSVDLWARGVQKIAGILGKIGEGIAKWGNAIGELFASVTAGKLQDINAEEEANNKKNKKAIDSEKDRLNTQLKNEALTMEQRDQLKAESDSRLRAIEDGNEKRQIAFEARKKAAIRKQAIYEKSLALALAVIAGAQAVVTNLIKGPIYAIAAGALAAVQIAAIASRPIPAAERGIKGHKGGLILAGEKDHELVEMPGGKLAITDNKPTLYDLPAGTNIYAHNDRRTVDALATRNLPLVNRDRQPVKSDRAQELKMLGDIHRVIKNKPVANVNGYIEGYSIGSSRTNYINSFRNG